MSEAIRGPEIGQWYLHQDKGEMFRVIGFDRETGTIEIQNFDGDVDRLDADAWSSLPLEPAPEPEDWTGPIDDVEVDDLSYSETDMHPADWAEPLQPFQPQPEAWENKSPEEERDSGEESVSEEGDPEHEESASHELRPDGAGDGGAD